MLIIIVVMISIISSICRLSRYIYGALLQQGGLYLPYADSGRIIIGEDFLLVFRFDDFKLPWIYCVSLQALGGWLLSVINYH